MPDPIRITALPVATGLAETDNLVADRASGTGRATIAEVRELISSTIVPGWRNVLGSIVAVGGDVAIGASDGVLVVDTTSVRTLTLPDPATVTGKLPFLVIDASNGAAGKPISLVRFGAELIDGVASTKSLARDGGRWWVWTNGANWYTAECAPVVTSHADLTGLTTGDPHTQYALADGTRQRMQIGSLVASDAMEDAWQGAIFDCDAAAAIVITIPTGLTPGVSAEFVQAGAGQVQIAAGAGMTLRYPATFLPNTSEQWSTLVVTILASDEAIVRGDLEAA